MRKKRKTRAAPRRYAAKLLFQFRVVVNGSSGSRRLCEERTIVFQAQNVRSALAEAKSRGKKARLRYRNADGNPVFFELVGVLDLLELGPECEPDEVWYEIVEKIQPMERRKKLIPSAARLRSRRS